MKIVSDRAETLKKVRDFILDLPCLIKGGAGMYSTGPNPGLTFCNHAVFLIIKATDGNYKYFTKGRNDAPWLSNIENPQYRYKDSNYWCDILHERVANGKETGIIEVTAAKAQQLANLGYTVIGAWKNLDAYSPDKKPPPHYVTVKPDTSAFNEPKGPWVANVGAGENGYRTTNEVYGEKLVKQVRWYYNYKQDFRAFFDQLYALKTKKE
jgi:hypothetical protein